MDIHFKANTIQDDTKENLRPPQILGPELSEIGMQEWVPKPVMWSVNKGLLQ